MSSEYFYNLIQLFGVLLGLVGVFIVYRIQSIDANINTYRNNLITSIAQIEAGEATHAPDKRAEKDYDDLVSHYFLLYSGHTNETLEKHVDSINNKLNDIQMQPGQPYKESEPTNKTEYFRYASSKWFEEKRKKTKIKSSMRYSILLSGGAILLGLSMATYNSFELVNGISEISFISGVIFIFIILAFVSIVYISKYIYDSVK